MVAPTPRKRKLPDKWQFGDMFLPVMVTMLKGTLYRPGYKGRRFGEESEHSAKNLKECPFCNLFYLTKQQKFSNLYWYVISVVETF